MRSAIGVNHLDIVVIVPKGRVIRACQRIRIAVQFGGPGAVAQHSLNLSHSSQCVVAVDVVVGTLVAIRDDVPVIAPDGPAGSVMIRVIDNKEPGGGVKFCQQVAHAGTHLADG
ncbi:Uncharacterised protein [uncultured Ruminococcus sp.]|nr:Uncharacterised protein [uncultured Ruminococcus sp.]